MARATHSTTAEFQEGALRANAQRETGGSHEASSMDQLSAIGQHHFCCSLLVKCESQASIDSLEETTQGGDYREVGWEPFLETSYP